MTRYETVRNRIFAGSDMDYVGICPASALSGEPAGRRPTDLLPNAKSIVVFGRRQISGAIQAKFRMVEDGFGMISGRYSAHTTVLAINHLCMKETYDIAQFLENSYGCFAMPLTNNVLQAVQPEGNYVPFFADPYRAGLPVDIYKAAVAAGIGEMGWNHRVLTPDCGPRVYLCAIVTSLEFEQYDAPYAGPRLCDPEKCGICAKVCPPRALSASESEPWRLGDAERPVGKLNVNGCAAACFGFRRDTNARTAVVASCDCPDDAELAALLDKQFENPGFQTLDHLPTYCCDRCMVYCPVGNWNEQFRDRGLSKGREEHAMKKRIVLCSGFLPGGTLPYRGEYIYKVKAVREGAHGLGEGFPQPEFLELELEGVGGIGGKLEKTKPISHTFPLDCRIHHYYLLEHEVWIKNLGDLKYVTDWTPAEVWALAEERSYDDAGAVTAVRELGFAIIHSDRRAGYAV